MNTIPTPVGVGYFPKKTQPRPPEYLKETKVEEICSVSSCIAKAPADYINKWIHNDVGFYDNEALAWQVVGEDHAGFELYAYKVYPLEFDKGEVRPWKVPIQLHLDFDKFSFIGFDLVTRAGCSEFAHSALSCNAGADNFPVNKFCLMDKYQSAFQACVEVSNGKYEPGPYYLFEIYRQKNGG
jgi:hypothetical protein